VDTSVLVATEKGPANCEKMLKPVSNVFFAGLDVPNKKLLQKRSNGLGMVEGGCYGNQHTCLASRGPPPEEQDGFCYEIWELYCIYFPTIYF
jgi:hypothetical protein